MKILFTICGRAGSKGIKNKNLRDFLGKPLAYYTVSAIDLYLKRNNDLEYDIVINSDSDKLLEMMDKNPMRKVELIERDSSLGGDTVGKVDVIFNCLEIMEARKKCKYDMVVDLDITSPLRRVQDIARVITTYQETGADVTTTVATARRNPYFNQVKKVQHGYKKVIDSNFTARQQAPEIFDMNASIYAYRPEFLFSGKGVLDGYVECVEMYDTAVLDLDHINDMELMQVIAKYLFDNEDEFAEVYKNI